MRDAFGEEHARIAQRMLGGADVAAEVVFTFDGDAAGQKAAMKAYELDQRFSAQTYVAVAPGGQDPCELRLSAGDEAVRQLVDGRVPLFEFAIRSTIERYDLDSESGRLAALDAAAPIIGAIRDRGLQQRYAINLDRWTGFLDERFVLDRVRRHSGGPGPAPPDRRPHRHRHRRVPPSTSTTPSPSWSAACSRARCRRPGRWPRCSTPSRRTPSGRRAPRRARRRRRRRGTGEAPQGPAWLTRVLDYADGPVASLVDELAAVDLPVSSEEELERWGRSLVAALAGQAATRAVADPGVRSCAWTPRPGRGVPGRLRRAVPPRAGPPDLAGTGPGRA